MNRTSCVNQKAVPIKKEALKCDSSQLSANNIFARDLIKKLKNISEHQIIGNR